MPIIEHIPVIEHMPLIEHMHVIEQKNSITAVNWGEKFQNSVAAKIAQDIYYITLTPI